MAFMISARERQRADENRRTVGKAGEESYVTKIMTAQRCADTECKKCGNRFLPLEVKNKIPCPSVRDRLGEIGPDELRIF